jgi:Transposase DDE domain/Putative transposase of IS4/5 family (DUF4096)
MTSSACWSRSFHPPSSAGGRGPRTCGVCWTGCSTSCAPAGCQWRHLPPPPAFPPWRTVYGYLRAFLRDGVWESIRHHFVVMLREGAGREASPTAVVIDTRSVKTTESGGPRGWDAAKRLMGRKRHVAVDTDGLLLGVLAHAANIQDADALGDLLRRVKPLYNWLRVVFADSIYNRLAALLACFLAGLVLPGRSGADHRPSRRRHYRLRRAAAPVGGRKVARLTWTMAAPVQGLRGAAGGFRGDGHPGRDPPDAPPPRPSQSQATARPMTFQTGCNGACPAPRRLAKGQDFPRWV